MRRFSQKNALVTLADINVTPLLDLAFVLLIIFVITTPLLEQNLDLTLPRGGRVDDAKLDRRDVKTVEISQAGAYQLDGQALDLDRVAQALVIVYRANPKLVVDIRADARSSWEAVALLLDRCQKSGITRIRPRMLAER